MNGGVLLSIARKRRIIGALFLIFAATMIFSLVATPLAQAAKYGPIGSPGLNWNDSIVLNGRERGQNPYPEMISFTCNNPNTGKPFSNEAKKTIREISNNSVTIFTGNFDAEKTFGKIDLGDSEEDFKNQPNYGMAGGPVGMQKYLRGENDLLRQRIFSKDIGNTDTGEVAGFLTNTFGQGFGVLGDAASGAVDTAQAGGNLVTGDLGGAVSEVDSALGNSPLASSARAWAEVYGGASSLLSDKKPQPKSAWTEFGERSLNSNRGDSTDHGGGFYVWAKAGGKTAYVDKDGNTENAWDELGEYNSTFKLSPEDGRVIAKMINAKAQTPIQAFMSVPAGCPLPDWDTAEDLSLSDFFNDILGGFTRLVLAIPSMILDAVYGLVYPQAWKYAFYTPHTERGDTIFDMSTTCTPGSKSTSCKGYTELGYTTPNLDGSKEKRPMYLKLTSMIQWLLSGTYFLILFTSAVLFIFRGNRSQTLQLMRVGPRIALVLMFTFILPFFMGAVISLSNLTIISILDFGNKGAGTNLAEANILSSQIGAWFSEDPNGIVYPVIKFATGLAATLAAVMVLASAYIRQLLLIILVVSAPIAIFCLIVDSWRPQFKRWLRVFFVVTLFPIVLGIILKIGMFLNPIFNIRSEKAAENFGQGDAVTAFVMLIIMFWAMARAVKVAQGMIGNPGGGAMGAAGGILGQLGQGLKANRFTAPLGLAMGAAGYGLGRASQAPTDMKAALIPGGRGSMGAGGGMFGGAGAGMGPGGGPGGLLPGGGRAANAINEKFAKFAENGKGRAAERKAMRKAVRGAKREDWLAGDKKMFGFIPSPRGMARGVTGRIANHMPDSVRGKKGSLRRKLFDGANARAQGRMTSISEGEAQQKLAARRQLATSLAATGMSGREIQKTLDRELGAAPVNRGGGWKQFVTAEQHREHENKSHINAVMSAMEAKTGHRPDLYKSRVVYDEHGNPMEKMLKGADYDKFEQAAERMGYTVINQDELANMAKEHGFGKDTESMLKKLKDEHPEYILDEDLQMFGRRH